MKPVGGGRNHLWYLCRASDSVKNLLPNHRWVVAEMQQRRDNWQKCLVVVLLSLALASWFEEGVKELQYHT